MRENVTEIALNGIGHSWFFGITEENAILTDFDENHSRNVLEEFALICPRGF